MRQKWQQPTVRFVFGDGGVVDMTAVAVQRHWLRETMLLSNSDDPIARAIGRARLEEVAQLLAVARLQPLRASVSARRPRATHPIKARVLALMRRHRADHVEFKTFLAAWVSGPMDGLSLQLLPGSGQYQVADDDALDEVGRTYGLGTLTKMYSVA